MNKKWTPHIIAVGAFVVFIVLGLACASEPDFYKDTAKECLKNGDSYFKQGNYSMAIFSYEQALIYDPNSKEAKKKLADPKILAYQKKETEEKLKEEQRKIESEAAALAAEAAKGNIRLFSAYEGTVLVNGEETKFKAKVRTSSNVYTEITIENAKDKEFSIAVRDSAGKIYQAEKKVIFNGKDYKWVQYMKGYEKYTYEVYIYNSDGTFYNPESDFEVTVTADGRGAKITGYKGKDNDVSIPSTIQGMPVREIGGFDGYRNNIDTVTIPEGVTTISSVGFSMGFTGTVRFVKIPSTVTTIGRQAFEGCKNLGAIGLPAGLKNLGESVFARSGIYIFPTWPTGITTIPEMTFYDTQLTNVVIPNGVTIIGKGAFKDCKKLTSITLPATIKRIEVEAFAGTNITEVIIPSSVTKIEFGGWAGFPNSLSLASQAALKRVGYSWSF